MLTEAVDSVLAQEPCELVVVDAGSTDSATLDILEKLRRRGVRVIRQENARFGPARVRGVKATTAPYVLTLNADDRLCGGALGRLSDWLDAQTNLGAIWGRYRSMDDATHIRDVARNIDPWLISYLNDLPASALFRRSTLDEVGAWTSPELQEDWHLWMALAEAGVEGLGIEDVVYDQRLVGTSKRRFARRDYRSARDTLRERHRKLYGDRRSNRRRSDAPLIAKLLLPLNERIPIGTTYRRERVAAGILHVTRRRGGYVRAFRRSIKRLRVLLFSAMAAREKGEL
jgi:glycosyltransferase involved in cell wall biosynthesis